MPIDKIIISLLLAFSTMSYADVLSTNTVSTNTVPTNTVPTKTVPTDVDSTNITSTEILKPFTSDGCSAFPDGTFKQKDLWHSCCVAHDYAYWKGGTYQEKLDADEALKACVSDIGEPEIAEVMFLGVQVGGLPVWPTTFRWGYGWSFPHLYKELTEEERAQIRAMEVNLKSLN